MTCLKCGAVDWDHVCYKGIDKMGSKGSEISKQLEAEGKYNPKKSMKDMTYQEIADTLYAEDPGGVIDLIYFLLEKNPEWQQEIKNWKF